MRAKQREQSFAIRVATDERRELSRQIGRASIGAPRRWKIAAQPRPIDLQHADRLQRIVERVCAEKPELVPAVAFGRNHLSRSGGHEDLSAMRKRQQARRTVHRRTEVIRVAPLRRADMERHAHGQAADCRPVACRKRLLCSDGRVDRVRGKIECGEKAIAGSLENATAVAGDGVVQDSIVLVQRFLHRRAMVEPAQAGSFDVGEQERYDVGKATAGRRCSRVRRISAQLPRYAHRAVHFQPRCASLANTRGLDEAVGCHAAPGIGDVTPRETIRRVANATSDERRETIVQPRASRVFSVVHSEDRGSQ